MLSYLMPFEAAFATEFHVAERALIFLYMEMDILNVLMQIFLHMHSSTNWTSNLGKRKEIADH